MKPIPTIFIFALLAPLALSLCRNEIRKLPDYTCVKEDPIGMGARGTAYLINRDGKNYLLKVQDLQSTYKKELDRLEQLKDVAYVVQLIEHVKTWDKLYLVLSYASQGELGQFMEDSDYFDDIENIFSFFRKLKTGLDTIHERGIVHADLKAENIVVDEDDNPVIIDFDISARIGDLEYPRGTLDNMPPEMLLHFETQEKIKYLPEMDYFSFGTLLYEVMKNTRPFHLSAYSYYEMMTAPIKFDYADVQYFFDICFGLLQPASNRMDQAKVDEIFDQAAFASEFEGLSKAFKYQLVDYANEQEKPKRPNDFLMYLLLFLAVLFVVVVGFLLKKCLVKKEGPSEEQKKMAESLGSTQQGDNLEL